MCFVTWRGQMNEKSILVLWHVIQFFPVPYRLATCARINTSNWNIAESQSISISCFLGNFEVWDKCWLLHFTDLQQIVTSPSHTRTLYLVNLLAISSSNGFQPASICIEKYAFFYGKEMTDANLPEKTSGGLRNDWCEFAGKDQWRI